MKSLVCDSMNLMLFNQRKKAIPVIITFCVQAGDIGCCVTYIPIRYRYAMPVRRDIPYQEGLFFITFTCFKCIPLIDLTNSYDLIYSWFNYLKNKTIVLPVMSSCLIIFMH